MANGKLDVKAYCVGCKNKQSVKNGKKSKAKNGRDMVKGRCGKCDGKVTVFVKKNC